MTTETAEGAPAYRPIPALKKWLDRRNIRQYDLAQMLGVREGTVSRWLSGHRSIPAEKALILSEVTGIPAEQLSNRAGTTRLLKLLGKRSTTGGRHAK